MFQNIYLKLSLPPCDNKIKEIVLCSNNHFFLYAYYLCFSSSENLNYTDNFFETSTFPGGL